jgi:hypothetical protein
MKPVRLTHIPLILSVFRPELGKTGEVIREYHCESEAPKRTEDIQELIGKYMGVEGEYLANSVPLGRVDMPLAFKKISERKAAALGKYGADFVKMHLKAEIILPKPFELLEELIENSITRLKIVEASGLANLRNIRGEKLEYLAGEFFREHGMPNFSSPFELRGIDFSYAQHGSGIDFRMS